MMPFLSVFGLKIPMYGIMIVLSLFTVNTIAFIITKKNNESFDDFLLAECFFCLGAVIGSKALYLILNIHMIEWSRILELNYVKSLMNSGFVFFGGLFGGFLGIKAGKSLNVISAGHDYLNEYAFLFPLGHGIGRFGCHFAGCCYGIEYHGICHLRFPPESFAPSDTELFPVQLTEALLLFILAVYILMKENNKGTSFAVYISIYSIIRFFTEFLRGDDIERGVYFLSTSQWIALLILIITVIKPDIFNLRTDQ